MIKKLIISIIIFLFCLLAYSIDLPLQQDKDKLSIKNLDLYYRWLRWQEQQKTNVDYGYVLNQTLRANESETEKLERLKSEIEDLRYSLDRDLKYKLDQMKGDMESEMMRQKIRFESEMFQKRLEIESDIRWAITTDMIFRKTFPNYKPYNSWLYFALLRYFY